MKCIDASILDRPIAKTVLLCMMIPSFFLILGVAPEAQAAMESSTVKIIASKKPVDIGRPWQFRRVSQQTHLGVIVADGLILTTAYAVDSTASFEIQLFGNSRKYKAMVHFVDYESNLALLKPANSQLLLKMKPMPLGQDLKIGEKVNIMRARDDYQMTAMPAHLSEVATYAAVTSSYTMAVYLLKVQQTGLGWTEPVMSAGKLVGLSTGQDSNFVHAMPVSMIRHFLKESPHQESTYKGFPAIGIGLSALVDPVARQHYQVPVPDGGVRITEVVEGSGFKDLLKKDDVLMELDGHKISEHGYYQHPQWGKVHLKYLVNQKFPGDEMEAKVYRGGKLEIIRSKLVRHKSTNFKIPYNRYGKPEPHMIFGGLVFQELTRDYLEQWGSDWRKLAPYDLLYLNRFEDEATIDDQKRWMVLGSVLTDQFNRGYEKLKHALIVSVNGQKVSSIEEVRAALDQHGIGKKGRLFAKIALSGGHGEVILEYGEVNAAHKRIAKTYNVTSPDSFYSLPVKK